MNYRECQIFKTRFLITLTVMCGLFLFASCGQSLQSHLDKGEEFLAKRKFEEAAMQFRAASQIDDSSAEAYWGLARSLEAQNNFLETVEALHRVSDLDPDNLEAKAKLGNYYLLFSPPQIGESEKILADIFERDEDFIEGVILQASIFSARGKTEAEIVAVLDKAISLDEKRTESYLAKSRFFMKINKSDEAEVVIQEAISVNEERSLGYIEYGRFLTYASRSGESEAQYLKAIEVEPKNIEAREAIATYYLANRKLEEAEKAYKDLADVQGNTPESRMDLASFYSIVGREGDAIKTYEAILEEAPKYVRARYKLANVYLGRKEYAKVNEQVEILLSMNDKDVEALMIQARVNLGQDNPEAAVNDLEEVLKQQPSLKTALYYMTQTRLALGQPDQARAFISDLEKYHPTYRRIALLKIQSAFAANEAEIALQEANKLISSTENAFSTSAENAQELEELRVRGITSRGMANLQLGNTAEAEKDLLEVVRLSPSSSSAKINLARVYIVKNNLATALELYDAALAKDEMNFDALSGAISVLMRQKEFEKAHAKIGQLVAKVEKDNKILPALHYLNADVYLAENNLDEAESEIKKSIELDESYLPAYSAFASILITKNEMDAALEQYEKVVEKKPSAAVYSLIGMLQDSKQNFEEAEKSYRKALEVNPGNPIAANNLAWLIADQNRGNLDEALKLAQDTVDKNRKEAGYYDTLGWVNFKKGFYSQAVESFKQAVELDELQAKSLGKATNPAFRLRLAMALDSAGEKDMARREVAVALKNGKESLTPKDIQNAKNILSGS